MFLGNFQHNIDKKGRVFIPSKFREELGEGYSITVGTGKCLYVYSKEQTAEVKKALSNINPYREQQLKAARYILFNTWEAEEDKQKLQSRCQNYHFYDDR